MIVFCKNITSGSSVIEVIAYDPLPGKVLGKPMISGYSQRCQVRDFIPRSRDFLNQLGCFWDFYFKNSISGFFGDFSELQVLNLVIKFLLKLAS